MASINQFIEVVQRRNPHIKILEGARITEKLTDEETTQEVKALIERANQFVERINDLKLQTRLAIMALLSQRKASIYNDSLIMLMELLCSDDWNRGDDLDASSDSEDLVTNDKNTTKAAFIIDKMHTTLCCVEYPETNLVKKFKMCADDPQVLQEYDDLITQRQESKKVNNFLIQRRVKVTPTMILYSRAQEEESNLVIRKFKDVLFNFCRLSFVGDDLLKGYYFGDNKGFIVGYLHQVITSGFQLGNLKFEFLGYSNSQLKNHSFWFMCNNNPDSPISEAQIVNFMGSFDHETNLLKRFARKGQCFSTSKFVADLNPEGVEMNCPDIKRNGFNFTDGFGYISEGLSDKIAQ